MAEEKTKPRRRVAYLAVTLLAYVLLSSAAARSKPPFNDEAWLASPSLNLATAGHMGTTIVEGEQTWLEGVDRHTYWVLPLYLLTQAGWYKALGFSLYSMRLATAFWGCVLLVALWFLLKSRSHPGTAHLWAVPLLGLDYFFVQLGGVGRMDMMSAALGLAGLATFVNLRERSLPVAVLVANTLTAASLFTHPYGLLHVVGLLFLMIYYDRSSLSWRLLASSTVPYAMLALAWGLYISVDLSSFAQQFTGNAGVREPISLLPWAALRQEIVGRWLTMYGLVGRRGVADLVKAVFLIGPLGGVVISVGLRAIRTPKENRAILWLVGLYFLLMMFFEVKRSALYIVPILPLMAACAGMALDWGWTAFPRWRKLILASFVGLVAIHVAAIGAFVRADAYERDYRPVTDFLNEEVAPGEVVMGRAEIAFAIGFDRVLDDVRLGFHTGKRPRVIVIGDEYRDYFERFERAEPEVHAHIRRMLDSQYTRQYSDPRYDVYIRADAGR